MRVTTVIDEDFTNYKKPSMFIGTISCGGKCCLEAGIPLSVCQNDGWRSGAPINIDDRELCERYLNNPVTEAIVFGGLEPLEQPGEVIGFIRTLRTEFGCDDDIVIYTGYDAHECSAFLNACVTQFKNIVVKFGRFVPNSTQRFDEILGVKLVSENQYAVRVS